VFHYSNRFLGQKLFEREHLVIWSIIIVENPIIGPKFWTFSTYSFMYLLQYFHIVSLVNCLALWLNSKWTIPLILKKVISIVFIHDFYMGALCELFMSLKNTWLFHSFSPICLESFAQVSLAFFPNFMQNLMLIHCSENRTFNFVMRHRNIHTLSAQLLPHKWR
jgi:hypothetical protein